MEEVGGDSLVATGAAIVWQRSTFCSSSACVEVGVTPLGVAVRDSKDHRAAMLQYTPDEWRAFVQGVKAGEFDYSFH